jgi:site-specific DNA recombinase
MNTNSLQVAFYARVSSEQQASANTIESQIVSLRQRIEVDGFTLSEELQFIDDGYSGTTLVRPGLERLRDMASINGLDRLYVHSPDRLARKYAYQVLLVDELQRAGVEVIFLNRELGRSPEDDLLLQVQGMIAEYERAKILERSRRGKRHAAHSGSVNVLSCAPYGYRYVDKRTGGGQACYEIELEQAQVVRQVFTWVGEERISIGEVCRRLKQAGILTQTGKSTWDRSTIWEMLKNPAYKGMAAFGKTATGEMQPRLRPGRGQSSQPRRPYSTYPVDSKEWIGIPVPALVDESIFEAVQQQLEENRKHARQRRRGATYLLQGLAVCKCCGYSYYGKPISNKSAKGKIRNYGYYRCIGTDAYRFGGQRICSNTQVRTDRLEAAVWGEVQSLLENPQRLEAEYHRRETEPSSAKQQNLTALETQIAKARRGLGRLIDSYAEGLIDKTEFEPRITRLKERITALETQAKQVIDEVAQTTEIRLIIGRLEEFSTRVKDGLTKMDWSTQREIIRTLVKRVEIEQEKVNVVFRVAPNPSISDPGKDCLQHCGGRGHSTLGRSLVWKTNICACLEASENSELQSPWGNQVVHNG